MVRHLAVAGHMAASTSPIAKPNTSESAQRLLTNLISFAARSASPHGGSCPWRCRNDEACFANACFFNAAMSALWMACSGMLGDNAHSPRNASDNKLH